MEILDERVASLHWLFNDDCYFLGFGVGEFDSPEREEWERSFDSMILREWYGGVQLASPGFMPEFAKHMAPQWADLVGFESFPEVPEPDLSHVVHVPDFATEGQIFASCIDAGYWQFYSPDESWLELLRAAFPCAQDVRLADKRV